ncbi:hypothetical protein [Streptomyces sp. SID1121]|uniref:hypothetical protein n=1 Tax=Streptomyces sp. SID1121 TaxID=3425888 RepID=UPI004055C559
MKAQTNAAGGPHLPVTITFGTDDRPRVTTVYARALYELLTRDGFLLDPATGQCYLPETVEDAAQRTLQAGRRLDELGFSPVITAADSTAASANRPYRPAPSAPSVPVPGQTPGRRVSH